MLNKFSRHFPTLTRQQLILKRESSAVINAKPFKDIPGPPGNGLPVIGHMNLVTKKPHGIGKSWLNIEILIKKYLENDDKLLRISSGTLFPGTEGRYVILLDPSDVEHVHRNEGKYPNR